MFNEFGKTLKAIFKMFSKGAKAGERIMGATEIVGEGLEESTRILKDDFIEDMKIDQQVDRAKRAKKKAKAMAKVAAIQIELVDLNKTLPKDMQVDFTSI